jgi:hypothetical protein
VASSIPEPTKTALPTKTPEPTATPEVPMTLEDWKKVFSGNFTNRLGKVYPLELMFDEVDLLSGPSAMERLEAIEKSGGVTESTSIAILGTDRAITIITEIAFAKEQVQNGSSLLTLKENVYTPAYLASWIFEAAQEDVQNGKHKITRIRFGEITSVTFSDNFADSYRIEGLLPIKDIVDMPKHFKVHMTDYDDALSLADIGITNIDPTRWIETLFEAGVKYVAIYAQ